MDKIPLPFWLALTMLIQEIIRRIATRKSHDTLSTQTADKVTSQIANSIPRMRAVSDEGMNSPTSHSGIFWKNRAEKQEEVLAAARRIIFSTDYTASRENLRAIEAILVPKPGESSDISITIPGKDRDKV